MHSRVQRWIAAQVRLSSCGYVFAVTVPIEYGRVERIQFAIQAPSVDLPVPCPLDAAMRTGITGSMPLNRRWRTSFPRSIRKRSWLASGPSSFASSVFFRRQGYAKWTKPSGSSANWGISSASRRSGASCGRLIAFHFEQAPTPLLDVFGEVDRAGVLDAGAVAVFIRHGAAGQEHQQRIGFAIDGAAHDFGFDHIGESALRRGERGAVRLIGFEFLIMRLAGIACDRAGLIHAAGARESL